MKAPQKSLKKWTKQKWRTSDGSKSEGKKRYLPDKAWDSLSASEKAATNAAKAEGNKKGKQFVAQPKKVAKKVKQFRAAEGGMAKGKKMTCPKCKGAGCSHCGGKGYHMGMSKGGDTGKNPNKGIAALRRVAPGAVKAMGYKHGGLTRSTGKLDTGIKGCE
jgi:hypothetical protein